MLKRLNLVFFMSTLLKKIEKECTLSPHKSLVIGLISHVKKCPVWFVAAENDEGKLHVEIRSNLINVQEIAASFGGGGHTFAAGFTSKKDASEALQELIDKLVDILSKKRG